MCMKMGSHYNQQVPRANGSESCYDCRPRGHDSFVLARPHLIHLLVLGTLLHSQPQNASKSKSCLILTSNFRQHLQQSKTWQDLLFVSGLLPLVVFGCLLNTTLPLPPPQATSANLILRKTLRREHQNHRVVCTFSTCIPPEPH